MYRGILCLLIAEFCFALSTVFGKFVTTGSDITGVELTFFRFLIGTVAVSAVMITTRISFRPVRTRYVVLRAILNTFAVLAFFTGIQYTTVTNANMLNLTYPVFVFCIAPFLNREKNHPANYLYLCIALIGVYLIINPDFRSINPGDISALLSGVIAGFGISILRESRKYDSSEVILFYLMMIGCLISFFVMLPFFIMPRGMMLVHTLLSGGIAVAGQACITFGYRYIGAAPGSVVSSSRMLFAVCIGVWFFADPLSIAIITGGVLLLIALIGISGIVTIPRMKGDRR